MTNGPGLWGLLLDALGVPGAVMGGGCIRDNELGLEPKDYDIFVPFERKSDLAALAARHNDLGVMGFDSEEADYHEESSITGALIGVLDGELLGYPVNVIARKAHLASVDALIDSFDFGCVQAAWCPERGIRYTAAFEADIANRTATVMRQDTHQLSICRYARFDNRNPRALRLVDPFSATFDFT